MNVPLSAPLASDSRRRRRLPASSARLAPVEPKDLDEQRIIGVGRKPTRRDPTGASLVEHGVAHALCCTLVFLCMIAAIAPAERYRQLAFALPDGDVGGRAILGRVLVAAGRRAEARALLAPIFDPAHPLAGSPIDVEAARFALARALEHGDAGRGAALEQAARDALTKLGPAGLEVIRDLDS
jgi:hypothetical protein